MNISSVTSSSTLQQLQRPSGPPPSGGGPEKTTAAVADLLGMDADALTQALQSGQTMSDLASAAGVSQADLISTIQATLPTQAPDGTAVDTAAMASGIAAGQRPGPPPKPPVDAASGLDALSSSLGVSSDELLQRLTDGAGIADLLQDNPQVAAQLAAAQNKGAVVDGYA